MKISRIGIVLLLQFWVLSPGAHSAKLIPANDPNIQYSGRWDFSVPTAPTHSWPGVYVFAKFEGTSIGISTNDNFSYYNVIIDDTVSSIFHGTAANVANYTLASGMSDTQHSILLTLRNETNWTKFSFNGFLVDDGKNLLPPPAQPAKNIEFIGDSYTCASGNLWINNTAAPSGDYTDLYEGFPSITARHYGAQYMVSGRGGFGLVLDYQGNYGNTLPYFYDRALVYTPLPKWDFSRWNANLVVICLGLNDYNGWGGYSGPISEDNATLFRFKYHDFISTIMDLYPFAKILTVAANDISWLKQEISQVTQEENALGHTNVHYTYFPSYSADFVNSGHPDVKAHNEIANNLIGVIDTIDAWTPFKSAVPPRFVALPDTPVVATSTQFLLTVKTDRYATVRYSTADKPFAQMEHLFTTTGSRVHSVSLPCEQHRQYTYYVRAMDAYGNDVDSAAIIRFTVDTTKVVYAWKSVGYDLSAWKTGAAPLGNDHSGLLNTLLDSTQTAYFRHSVTLHDVANIYDMRAFIKGHDGVVAYVNGQEYGRININPGTDVSFSTYAIRPQTYASTIAMSSTSGLNYLREGENVFSFEVHSRNTSAPDISFDAMIFDNTNTTYYDLGSAWTYSDMGKMPANQLADKPVTGVQAQHQGQSPRRSFLYANYPNPFNPSTTISFDLNTKSYVELKVFNVLGQLVQSLVGADLEPGTYAFAFHAENCASGMYFYQLKAGTYLGIKKMMLVK